MKKLELWYPVKPNPISQKFGENPMDYDWLGIAGHNGIDFAVGTGTMVRAAHDGMVVFTGMDGSGGETIILRTTEKFAWSWGEDFFKTIYVHLKTGSYLVKPGQIIKAGTPLALSNNTGWSTGPHLHFGLKPIAPGENDWDWYNTKQNNGFKGAIDPMPYFNGFFAEDKDIVLGTLNTIVDVLKKLLSKFTP
jgi:murein DD-endopeptidase MepM/ murein hydrolase activator NlpD